MATPSPNLLTGWLANVDSLELRAALHQAAYGHGQVSLQDDGEALVYLPIAGATCELVLSYRGAKLTAARPGPAFTPTKWHNTTQSIHQQCVVGTQAYGREFSFASYEVLGSWRGPRSRIQILPADPAAPRPQYESGWHPFVLEVPILESSNWQITNLRRMREHRRITMILNALIAGYTVAEHGQAGHVWAFDATFVGQQPSRWLKRGYSGPLVYQPVSKRPERQPGNPVERLPSASYYTAVQGLDGLPLRVPKNLDDRLVTYLRLDTRRRSRFDLAAYWLSMASGFWPSSISASFASLVIALEALHHHKRQRTRQAFMDLVEHYVPDPAFDSLRRRMYKVRSEILHGLSLMSYDVNPAALVGLLPFEHVERELQSELWRLTKLVMRRWLLHPN